MCVSESAILTGSNLLHNVIYTILVSMRTGHTSREHDKKYIGVLLLIK